MNAVIEVPEVIAESTHSRIDWTEPAANPNVTSDTGPIAILRDANGSFLAVEDVPDIPAVAQPMTIVQHMKSADLRRNCIVWAKWDGVKESGFWDATPTRMPLYRAEGVTLEVAPTKPGRKRTQKTTATKRKRSPRTTA